MDSVEMPLFPLGTVLFPKQLLPLRIFEERYKVMVEDCLKKGTGFGVVLIKQGSEVGSPAIPFEVGTAARIVEAQKLPENRYNLQTVGERPFRVIRFLEGNPYMVGEVEYLSYEIGESEDMESRIADVKRKFEVYLNNLALMSAGGAIEIDLEVGPERLSYLVASLLAIKMREKQLLLELSQAYERLKVESDILERENKKLQDFVHRQNRELQGLGEADLLGRISPN